MMVGRQSPRNSRIIAAVSAAAVSASRTTPSIEARTNSDWSNSDLIFKLRGQRLGRNGQHPLDAVHNLQGGGVAVLQHRHDCPADAVLPHDVGLRRKPVAHVGHVAYIDGGAVHGLHRQLVQLGDGLRRAVHLDLVFQRPDLRRARGQDQILRVDRIDHIDRRKPVGLQAGHVEIDLDLTLLAAVGPRNGQAGHGDQLRAQLVGAEVEQLLLG